jgi:hypothetical protein
MGLLKLRSGIQPGDSSPQPDLFLPLFLVFPGPHWTVAELLDSTMSHGDGPMGMGPWEWAQRLALALLRDLGRAVSRCRAMVSCL